MPRRPPPKVTRSPSMGDDFARSLDIVCETAVRLARVEHSHIALFNAELNAGEICAEFPRGLGLAGKKVRVPRAFSKPSLLKAINPLVIEDLEEDRTPAAADIRALNSTIKSTVIVPIIVNQKVRGSFAFNFLSNQHEFSAAEIEHLNYLGQLAALIFTNADLLNETRIQTERLEALRKAMLAITAEPKREPLLRTIIEEAIKLLQAEGGGIYKYKPRRHLLELVEDYKWPNQIGVLLKPGEGLSGRLFISNKEYIETPDYQKWEGKAESIKEDVGSALGVPLYWQNRRTGVLFVNGERGRQFTEEEAELLQRFAAMASIALEHSRLRERDHYMVKRLHSLALATNDIIGSLDDPDMDGQLTQIARYAHEILDAEACGIHQVKRPGYLTLVASDGHRPGGFQKGREFKIISGERTGLTGHIAHEQKPFRKCGKELRGHFAVAHPKAAGGCQSLLAIPLVRNTRAGKEVTGLIRISNKKGRQGVPESWVCFTAADQSIAEIFAQAATVILTKTALLDQVRKGIDRYENLLRACNIIVNAVNIEKGLSELAIMLARLLDKSFCRIFLIDNSEKLLFTMAAEPQKPKEFSWQPLLRQMAQIAEWRNLDKSLASGEWTILKLEDDRHRDNLVRLSKKLSITDLEGKPLKVKSLLSIPLTIAQRKVGLINVGDLGTSNNEGFSQSQIELALTIAWQASVWIEKKWLEEQLTRRGDLNAAMFQALRHIRQTEGVEELFRVIVKQTLSLFWLSKVGPQPIAGMVIEDTARRTLRWIDSRDEAGELKQTSLKKLQGTLGSIATQENSQIVFNFKASPGEESFLAAHNLNILLAVYISISSRFRCILFVGDTETWSHLGRADLEILEMLGQHSGISLLKALAQEQALKTRHGNYLLAEAMALDKPEVMLGKAVEGILKSMDCDAVTLYVLDSRRRQLTFPPELAGVKDKAAALRVLDKERESVQKRVAAIDRYHAAEDTMSDDRLKGEFVRSQGIISSAGIPIIAQDQKIGVLFVNYRRRHRFDENDRKNMEFLAHEAAVAIRNVQMYNDMKAQQVRLEALYKTEHAIASSHELKHALETVAEQVWHVACANNRTANVVSINLIEDDKASVIAAFPEEELAHIKQELGGPVDLKKSRRIGLVGVAFQNGKSQIFTGLKRKPNAHHIRLHHDTQSELVSLIFESEGKEKTDGKAPRIVGAITVENSDEDAFDEQDLHVIDTLARQAGVVIANDKQSRHVQELNRENARLQVMSMMGVATNIWRHKIYHLAEKIDVSARKLDPYKNKVPSDTAKLNEELREIADSAKKLMQYLIDAPLSAEQGCRNELINEMIRYHLNELKTDQNHKRVSIESELELTRDTAVRVNKSWFLEALSFFTQNSLESLKNSQQKRLLITTMIDETACRIEISDTGMGMDEETWAILFDERKITKDQKGMGVGLLNARSIIEQYHGAVYKIANGPEGVIVGFSLPISLSTEDREQ